MVQISKLTKNEIKETLLFEKKKSLAKQEG